MSSRPRSRPTRARLRAVPEVGPRHPRPRVLATSRRSDAVQGAPAIDSRRPGCPPDASLDARDPGRAASGSLHSSCRSCWCRSCRPTHRERSRSVRRRRRTARRSWSAAPASWPTPAARCCSTGSRPACHVSGRSQRHPDRQLQGSHDGADRQHTITAMTQPKKARRCAAAVLATANLLVVAASHATPPPTPAPTPDAHPDAKADGRADPTRHRHRRRHPRRPVADLAADLPDPSRVLLPMVPGGMEPAGHEPVHEVPPDARKLRLEREWNAGGAPGGVPLRAHRCGHLVVVGTGQPDGPARADHPGRHGRNPDSLDRLLRAGGLVGSERQPDHLGPDVHPRSLRKRPVLPADRWSVRRVRLRRRCRQLRDGRPLDPGQRRHRCLPRPEGVPRLPEPAPTNPRAGTSTGRRARPTASLGTATASAPGSTRRTKPRLA